MNQFSKLAGSAAILAALAGGAYAQSHSGHGATHSMPGETPATKAFKEADARMMRDMETPYTGDVDVDFRRKMIPHHQGAIDMARVALAHATDPETKTMSRLIIEAQEKEIAEMRDWLKARGK